MRLFTVDLRLQAEGGRSVSEYRGDMNDRVPVYGLNRAVAVISIVKYPGNWRVAGHLGPSERPERDGIAMRVEAVDRPCEPGQHQNQCGYADSALRVVQ